MRPHWLSRKPLAVGLFLLVGAIAAIAGFVFNVERLGLTPAALDPLWKAEFKDLKGVPVRMADLRGPPMVINFWASWCGPCIEEMPDFQRASQTELGKRIRFVGIGIDYAKNMQPFADKLGISYLLLESGAQGLDIVKTAGNPSGALPFTLILDRNGAAVMRKLGRLEYADLMSAIDGL